MRPRKAFINPLPDPFLVVDLEATCNVDWSLEDMEIIEVGAFVLQAEQVVDEFHSFVRPARRPTLTDYCRELTGIDQQ